jgi:hypothetical protein
MPRVPSLFALVTLGACNQAFGLEPTRAVDAQYFDAPPPVCPAIGTPPAFKDELHQILVQNCTDFTVAANGRALARCGGLIKEGVVDSELTPAVGLEPPVTGTYLHPRISPDGASAVFLVSTHFEVVTHPDSGTWTKLGQFQVPNAFSSSSPSRNGRILVTASASSTSPGGLHELATSDGGATWTELDVHTHSDLDVASMSEGVTLTADGLRVIFVGQANGTPSLALLYADRATIDEPFSHAVPMPSVEYFPNAFLTEDCARLYTSTLGTVFYVTPP